MADRTITYRVKAGPGAWQRAVVDVDALPQSISGLVNGTTYEVDTGRGLVVDVTPSNPVADATVVHTADVDAAFLSTWTISGANLGATAADREFLVVISAHFLTALPAAADWECEVNSVIQPTAVYTHRPNRFASHFVYRVSVPAGTSGNVIFRRVAGTSALTGAAMQLIRLTGNPTLDLAGVVAITSGTGNDVMTISQDVLAGSAVVVGWASSGGGGTPVQTFAGITQQGGIGTVGASLPAAIVAFAGNVSPATPRVMTVTEAGNSNPTPSKSAFSLEIRA